MIADSATLHRRSLVDEQRRRLSYCRSGRDAFAQRGVVHCAGRSQEGHGGEIKGPSRAYVCTVICRCDAMPVDHRVGVRVLKLGSQIRVKVYRFRLKLTVRVKVKVRQKTINSAHVAAVRILVTLLRIVPMRKVEGVSHLMVEEAKGRSFPDGVKFAKAGTSPPCRHARSWNRFRRRLYQGQGRGRAGGRLPSREAHLLRRRRC